MVDFDPPAIVSALMPAEAPLMSKAEMRKTLSAADRAIMLRLFGPELPTNDPFIAETEYAKAVEWAGDNSRPAVDTLLLSIVHKGVGGGMVIGWSLESVGDRMRLAIRRLKAARE